MAIREVHHTCKCGSTTIHYCSLPEVKDAPKEEKSALAKIEARLKAAVEMLGKVMPTWQGTPITAEVLSKACELLKSEGWASPKWDPPSPEVWKQHYGEKPKKEDEDASVK